MTDSMPAEDPQLEAKWRSWELELVISGALIVALFQVPGLLDSLLAKMLAHLSREVFVIPWMAIYMAQLVLYPIIFTFFLHFLLRGFWVGLIGLSSAFKGGIDWQRIEVQPLERSFYQSIGIGIPSLTAQVDRICSSLFSILFSIIIIFFSIGLLLFLVALPISLLISFVFPDLHVANLFIVVFLVALAGVLLPRSLALWLCRGMKKDPDWASQHPATLQRGYRLYGFTHYALLGFLLSPIMLTFLSSFRKRVINVVQTVIMTGLVAVILLNLFFMRGDIGLNSFVYFPDPALETGMDPMHYDALRPPNAYFQKPTIQSDMIRDPFVRLFIPFRPRVDNPRVAEICPDLAGFRADGIVLAFEDSVGDEASRRAALDCLAGFYTIELNGRAIQPEFLFTSHAPSNVKGILTYVPVGALPSGQHLLKITKVALPSKAEEEEAKEGEGSRRVSYIPFWK